MYYLSSLCITCLYKNNFFKSDLNKKNLIFKRNFFLNHDFFQPCLQVEFEPGVTDIIFDVFCYFKTVTFCQSVVCCVIIVILERCNPWPHVVSCHVSISQLLSSCCYLFTISNSGLLSIQRPRPASHAHLTLACQVHSSCTDHAQPAADNAPTSVTEALPTDS